jgi:hypothetical protein
LTRFANSSPLPFFNRVKAARERIARRRANHVVAKKIRQLSTAHAKTNDGKTPF